MDTLLKLDTVTAGYGGGDVLKKVTLEVERGSLTCIVGPNGAGKSTVLRVISGLLKPRQGNVIFEGRSIRGHSAQDILKQGIAQIPQEHSLFPDMTVRENMRLGGLLLETPSASKNAWERSRRSSPLSRNGRWSGPEICRVVSSVRSKLPAPSCSTLNWYW